MLRHILSCWDTCFPYFSYSYERKYNKKQPDHQIKLINSNSISSIPHDKHRFEITVQSISDCYQLFLRKIVS